MAKKRKPGAMYFSGIAAVNSKAAALTGHYYALEDSDDLRTVILTLNEGKWGTENVSGIGHAVCFEGKLGPGSWKIVVLDRNRGLYTWSGKGISYEKIDEDRTGFFMDLKKIGRRWYVVGARQQVYRKSGGSWEAIDDGIFLDSESAGAQLLTSIDGTSERDIYTVGFGGVIYHYDGSSWTALDSPTNYGLERVLAVDKGRVFACGRGGALLEKTEYGWRSLAEPDESIVYWDLAWFGGRLYTCTDDDLYALGDHGLEKVTPSVKGPLAYYRLSAASDVLWTCGQECVLSFDGNKWSQFVFPDNK